jgi:hypothetical protein
MPLALLTQTILIKMERLYKNSQKQLSILQNFGHDQIIFFAAEATDAVLFQQTVKQLKSTAAIMVNCFHYIQVNVVCNTELHLTNHKQCRKILEAIHLSYTLSDDPNIKAENSYSILDSNDNSDRENDGHEVQLDDSSVLDSESQKNTPNELIITTAAVAFASTQESPPSTSVKLDMPLIRNKRITGINGAQRYVAKYTSKSDIDDINYNTPTKTSSATLKCGI